MSSSTPASCPPRLSKPVMRGLLASQIKTNLIVGIGLAIASGIAFKFLVCDGRKARYADFYKSYDAEADYTRMKKLGLFQSG